MDEGKENFIQMQTQDLIEALMTAILEMLQCVDVIGHRSQGQGHKVKVTWLILYCLYLQG